MAVVALRTPGERGHIFPSLPLQDGVTYDTEQGGLSVSALFLEGGVLMMEFLVPASLCLWSCFSSFRRNVLQSDCRPFLGMCATSQGLSGWHRHQLFPTTRSLSHFTSTGRWALGEIPIDESAVLPLFSFPRVSLAPGVFASQEGSLFCF